LVAISQAIIAAVFLIVADRGDARQMWDIKTGSRGGEANSPMLPVATQLKPADILNIAAYLASCDP